MTLVPTPASGETCEATIDSPMAAAIEESASSSGTPAMVHRAEDDQQGDQR